MAQTWLCTQGISAMGVEKGLFKSDQNLYIYLHLSFYASQVQHNSVTTQHNLQI